MDAKNSYHRHSSHQIARLEQVFLRCTYPDTTQREQLGAELGLDPDQIKYWFQNKRIKQKGLNERYDNNTLRIENQKLQTENGILRDMLKNLYCPACQSPNVRCEEEHHISMQKLRVENTLLLQQCEKVSKLMEINCGINSSDLSTILSLHDSSPSWKTPMAMAPSTSTLSTLQASASSSSSSSIPILNNTSNP